MKRCQFNLKKGTFDLMEIIPELIDDQGKHKNGINLHEETLAELLDIKDKLLNMTEKELEDFEDLHSGKKTTKNKRNKSKSSD